MNPFYRLAPFIQEYIYRNHWDELRDVQVKAISEILDSYGHVLIAAGTASGKTEAAFFPMLTKLAQNNNESFGVLYIGPLKALINDQFSRIQDLLEEADFPIYAWHGDRAQSEKNRALKNPRGVLQITPEALEGLLMNRAGDARRMFQDLEFIVIDELHAFMGTDRGLQLQCQLVRIDRLVGRKIRRIGLSATINDYSAACEWLDGGSQLGTALVESSMGGRKLNLAMQHYVLSHDPKKREKEILQLNSYLYQQVRGQKSIVFTNSRMESELTAGALTELAAQRKEPECFYVHHGSVSKALREEAEAALKSDEKAATAIATRTLELGIDLGGLDRVIQLGAPNTCSSFVQRLGRTGRRGTPAVMRFITKNQTEGEAEFEDIPWELIQNIAIVQLYLEERWVEPFYQKRCPYSVLFHQFLSALMQKEQTPRELARSILTMPAFRCVSPSDGLELLKHMLSQDIVEKTEKGGLIPGLKGERLTSHYSFLSVFADDSGWRVIYMQREIGEIDAMPEVDAVIVLAGKSWRVSEIDEQHKKAYVVPSKGKTKNSWMGGYVEIHDRIVQRMKRVLIEDTVYPYLLPEAAEALRLARKHIAKLDLEKNYTAVGEKAIMLHPWLGTRKMQTLLYLLKHTFKEDLEVQYVSLARGGMAIHIVSEIPAEGFLADFTEKIKGLDEELLIADAVPTIFDRYDPFVPEALLKKAFVYDHLDIPGIYEWANGN